jgi:hypothetical protein
LGDKPAAGLAGRAAGFVGGDTLFAGWPPAVGGALAPSSGAFGVVTFGRCAGIPAAPAGAPPGCCGLPWRFGSFGVPEGVDGEGGVALDIRNSLVAALHRFHCHSSLAICHLLPVTRRRLSGGKALRVTSDKWPVILHRF